MSNISELRPQVADMQPERASSSVQKKSVLQINEIRIKKMETERRMKAVKHAKLIEGKRHAHTLTPLINEITRLKIELELLQNENESLKAEMNEERKRLNGVIEGSWEMKMKNDRLIEENLNLKTEIEDKKYEIMNLKHEIHTQCQYDNNNNNIDQRNEEEILTLRAIAVKYKRMIRVMRLKPRFKSFVNLKSRSQRSLRLQRFYKGKSVECRGDCVSVPVVYSWKLNLSLTDRQYNGIRKINRCLSSQLPSLSALKRWANEYCVRANLTSTNIYTGEKIVLIANIKNVFDDYILHLSRSVWNGIPESIDVVCTGDGGGDIGSSWVKLGFFIANDIPTVQSPNRLVMAAEYDGKEKEREIKEASSIMLNFFQSIILNGGRYKVGQNEINVRVFVVADLKFIPLFLNLPHHSSADFCPICDALRQDHHIQPILSAPRRQHANEGFQVSSELIVPPPLHIMQGLLNTIFHSLCKNNQKKQVYKILKSWSLNPSHRMSSLLTGGKCRKFLQKVIDGHTLRYARTLAKYGKVLRALHKLERYAVARRLLEEEIENLPHDIQKLSFEWRKVQLPATNKLHLVEAHLFPFIRKYKSWGIYGEQGLEALHRKGNIAARKCFGANSDYKLEFFMKAQLLGIFSDESNDDSDMVS